MVPMETPKKGWVFLWEGSFINWVRAIPQFRVFFSFLIFIYYSCGKSQQRTYYGNSGWHGNPTTHQEKNYSNSHPAQNRQMTSLAPPTHYLGVFESVAVTIFHQVKTWYLLKPPPGQLWTKKNWSNCSKKNMKKPYDPIHTTKKHLRVLLKLDLFAKDDHPLRSWLTLLLKVASLGKIYLHGNLRAPPMPPPRNKALLRDY